MKGRNMGTQQKTGKTVCITSKVFCILVDNCLIYFFATLLQSIITVTHISIKIKFTCKQKKRTLL